MSKETQEAYNRTKPPLSLLVREILTNHDLQRRPVRLVRTTPPPDHPSPYPKTVTLEDQVVLNQTTVLYEPTIADMDKLGATSVGMEWYDDETERWVRSK